MFQLHLGAYSSTCRTAFSISYYCNLTTISLNHDGCVRTNVVIAFMTHFYTSLLCFSPFNTVCKVPGEAGRLYLSKQQFAHSSTFLQIWLSLFQIIKVCNTSFRATVLSLFKVNLLWTPHCDQVSLNLANKTKEGSEESLVVVEAQAAQRDQGWHNNRFTSDLFALKHIS